MVIRGEDDELLAPARTWGGPGRVLGIATPEQAAAFAAAGFELFASRTAVDGRSTGYYCEHFVCALPVTDAEALADLLG